MNINQVKAATWLVSAGLTAGLSYYVFDYSMKHAELSAPRISREQAKEILDSAKIPEGPKLSLNDARSVERAFLELNWTGERPPKPVAPTVVDDAPKVVVYRPMEEMLSIQCVMEDLLHPDRGRAFILYKPAANVSAEGGDLSIEIRVGDRLSKPLEYAKVKAITTERGITFSFDDEARPDEDVLPKAYESDFLVHIVGKGERPIEATNVTVPRLDRKVWRPERTTMTKDNSFIIGTEDSLDFAEDYGGILAREVRHARHRDPKTGRYDGIELKEVKPGGRIAAHGGQSGDVIKSINGHPVTSTAEAITYVKNNQDKYNTWEVVVENKGKTRTMVYESPQGD
jgi:hypothetical protein